MCWVGVDRGLRIAERYTLPHDSQRWRSARRAMHRRVVVEGFSKQCNAFSQSLGSNVLDAALLRLTQVRFLPASDPRMASPLHAIARHLSEASPLLPPSNPDT